MDYKPELKGRINQKDEDGCTVLHVVAAHSPGYLTKRKWQHHSDSGAREHTQLTTLPIPSRDQL